MHLFAERMTRCLALTKGKGSAENIMQNRDTLFILPLHLQLFNLSADTGARMISELLSLKETRNRDESAVELITSSL